jgi:hypothetical protein
MFVMIAILLNAILPEDQEETEGSLRKTVA